MKRIAVSLSLTDSGYIGKPFWPETNVLINIGKDVHRPARPLTEIIDRTADYLSVETVASF